MTFFAAAIGGGALLGGALISANASGDAADTQAGASDRATAAQERMFNKQLDLQEPWRQAGTAGLNALLQYAGLLTPQQAQQQAAAPTFDEAAYLAANPDVAAEVAQGKLASGKQHYDMWGRTEGRNAPMTQAGQVPGAVAPTPIDSSLVGSVLKPFEAPAFNFQADPGYQFRLEQGEKGLTRAAQAGGGRSLTSGAYLKDAMKFNSGLASQEYGAAESRYQTDTTNKFNRYNINQGNVWNRLAGLAGVGQTATTQMGNAASNFGQQVGSNIIGAGNAQAAGQVGGANAWNNAIGQGISLYQTNKLLGAYPSGGVTPPNPYYGQAPLMDWYS
jgi:hypothetical protein